MSTRSIPPWDASGRLPPTHGSISPDRAPYKASLLDLVLRFGTSPERRAILSGFLAYRAELAAAGLTRGFQWVNGSFSEQVEIIRSRPPGDVDIVSFYRLPPGMDDPTFMAQHPHLFDHDRTKHRYHVDAYFVGLEWPPEDLVEHTSFWYSMWAHRRGDELWKGFVQVDLDTKGDRSAIDQSAQLDKDPVAP